MGTIATITVRGVFSSLTITNKLYYQDNALRLQAAWSSWRKMTLIRCCPETQIEGDH